MTPDIVGSTVLPVAVDTGGSAAWGQTVVDLRQLAWRARPEMRIPDPAGGNAPADGLGDVVVALEVDVERFRAQVQALAG
ncbi:nucleoside hydrolase [Nakamurella endophytica]|uniref:nucleoside hydrolase n=1 Tax=Nakamurella endophytica TaxID=1748367 RepID=UPI001E54CC82|nr:nucleoside hydrolase [Nakamurella endophytica]